jgi:hypothetical protein
VQAPSRPTYVEVKSIRRLLVCALVLPAALAAAPAAHASQLIARNAKDVRLEADTHGHALVSYRAHGKAWHVLAWGGLNAIHPSETRRPVSFTVDYSGGWGSSGRPVWRTLRNTCRPAKVRLGWLVTACRAADGTFWALQSWQRTLPDYGLPASGIHGAWELRLSHWRGPLPKLEIGTGWAYGRYHSLYGRLTWRGRPVYGFSSTAAGNPLDGFGRNIYVDTYDSAYGWGWHRENAFLSHVGTGGFCYGFYPHGDRPSGMGERYRATVSGPGVLPDVTWEGAAPKTYDRAYDLAADERQRALLGADPLCKPR